MPTYRFPVLVWQDYQGTFTAQPVGFGADAAAVDITEAAALRQVRNYLQWIY